MKEMVTVMKVFKRILFIIYLILTLFTIAASAMLFKMSADIEKDGYSELLNTNYMLFSQSNESYGIPANSLLRYYKSDSAYTVNDVVVCKNSDDGLYIGVVTDYSNDADYVTYLVDRAGEPVSVPKLYVLGKADNYSEFLGGIVAANQTAGARFLFLILPGLILAAGLVAIVIVVLVKRNKAVAEQRDEEEAQRFESAPLNTFDQHLPESKRERKPYVNPNSHTELLKYDWLKEVAVAAEENIAANAQSAAEQDSRQSSQDAEEEKSATESEGDKTSEQSGVNTVDKTNEDESMSELKSPHGNTDSVVGEIRQMQYSADSDDDNSSDDKSARKETKNDSMISEMLKLINQNSAPADKD